MFTLPQLPYDYSALEPWIDTETVKIHHDKHHQAYIDNLNKALERHKELVDSEIDWLITNLSKVPEDIRIKVRNNAGGHFNHSLYWEIMMANPKGHSDTPVEAKDVLSDAIITAFSNFQTFKEKFSTAGLNRFGSGWAWLVVHNKKLEIMDTPNQDNPLMDGPEKIPILGLDVWEHAYYLKYQNRRKDYIEAWWNVVNWDEVETRYKEAIS